MRHVRKLLRRPTLGVFSLFCLGLAAAGCGSGLKTVPVSGRIFVNGEPLTAADATVVFRPDASRGNTSTLDFTGKADKDGNYGH
jgi:hypothetical protein